MESEVIALHGLNAAASDRRASFFKRHTAGSSGKYTAAKNFIAASAHYTTEGVTKCLICGKTDKMSTAHLMASTKELDYTCWNRPYYASDFDRQSPRNYIPLCGSLFIPGSCHYLFDTYQLTILYNPINSKYQAHSFNNKFSNLNRELDIDPNALPYRRVLAWRTRECLTENVGRMTVEERKEFIDRCDFAEDAASVGSADSSWK